MVVYGQEGEVFTFHCIFFWGEEYSFIHEMKDKETEGGKKERNRSMWIITEETIHPLFTGTRTLKMF